jgi:hypothetical protein
MYMYVWLSLELWHTDTIRGNVEPSSIHLRNLKFLLAGL